MKYLLCRPTCGLNDSLCFIQNSIDFCKRYNRILLIDTNYNSLYKFNFSDVFKFIDDKNIIYDSNKIKEILNDKKLTIYPNEITNLYNYSLFFKDKIFINRTVLKSPNVYIQTHINFHINYKEDIIIHNHWTATPLLSHKLIKNLKLTDYYINDIIEKYNQIPKPYISIHIRNTDYKLNYKDFYNKNKEKIKDANIFLATDSIDALKFFKAQKLKIYSFTKLPNKNIPYHLSNNNKDDILLNTISDLFLLALGNNFIVPNMAIGGYTKLAFYLYKSKIVYDILDNKIEKPKIIETPIIKLLPINKTQIQVKQHFKKMILLRKN